MIFTLQRSMQRLPSLALLLSFFSPIFYFPSFCLFAEDSDSPTLHLSQGQFVGGSFEGTSADNEISWSNPAFDGPLTIDVKDVRRIAAWRSTAYPLRPVLLSNLWEAIFFSVNSSQPMRNHLRSKRRRLAGLNCRWKRLFV